MLRWDVFCRVVDNFGDIGVCWRLARQLSAEYGQNVRLWVDDAASLAAIWPSVDVLLETQDVAGVTVMRWSEEVAWEAVQVADVVVEAFDCKAPEKYISAMAVRRAMTGDAPRWINLEYMTAETWAQDCHLMSSPKQGGLERVFFFPGFTNKTGGLLRERGLLAQRDALDKTMVWAELTGFEHVDDALKITLFGYERMPLLTWLPCLVDSSVPIQLAVTAGQASAALRAAWQTLGFHSSCQQGALSVAFVPMLAQNRFDELLWGSDLNFVRGEDSLVRALWAGVPFVWQIYEQSDGAHWPKLDAFMALYSDDLSTDAAAACAVWQNWLRFWNGDIRFDAATAWTALMVEWPDLQRHARKKSDEWAQVDGLAQQLARRCGVYGQKSL